MQDSKFIETEGAKNRKCAKKWLLTVYDVNQDGLARAKALCMRILFFHGYDSHTYVVYLKIG